MAPALYIHVYCIAPAPDIHVYCCIACANREYRHVHRAAVGSLLTVGILQHIGNPDEAEVTLGLLQTVRVKAPASGAVGSCAFMVVFDGVDIISLVATKCRQGSVDDGESEAGSPVSHRSHLGPAVGGRVVPFVRLGWVLRGIVGVVVVWRPAPSHHDAPLVEGAGV